MDSNSGNMQNLRQAAERQLHKPVVTDEEIQAMGAEDLRRMVQDLRVYEIELEMQNETLRRTQEELEAARERYALLYDHAPIGYVSIDGKGVIRSANQTAGQLLHISPAKLIGKGFSAYVDVADRDKYFRFLKPLQDQEADNRWEEVRLIQKGGSRFYARLEGKPMEQGSEEASEILLCLSDISEKMAAEAELSKKKDQLRELAGYLQNVREEERAAISREIHDELGQVLSTVKLGLSDIESRMSESDSEIRDRIGHMKHTLAKTIKTTKSLITRLRPYMLDELGLIPALESYTHNFRQETGIETDLFVNVSDLDLGEKKETAVFRIIQEALSNVARHSNARHVVVNLSRNDQQLSVEISDDGIGIQETDFYSPQSCGLLGMRERAIALGGDVDIKSGATRGTHLNARIPV